MQTVDFDKKTHNLSEEFCRILRHSENRYECRQNHGKKYIIMLILAVTFDKICL